MKDRLLLAGCILSFALMLIGIIRRNIIIELLFFFCACVCFVLLKIASDMTGMSKDSKKRLIITIVFLVALNVFVRGFL